MQFVDFLPWRHCSHGWKNIFESLKCLHLRKKKNRTSSRWQLDGRDHQNQLFSTPKKGLTDNQPQTLACHPTRNAFATAEGRDGLGLQLSNSNCERRFAVQSEKTNSWEEISQPEPKKRRWFFVEIFWWIWTKKNNYIVLAAFPISEMQVKKWKALKPQKWLDQSVKPSMSLVLIVVISSNRVMATPLEWSLESWYIT